MGAGSAPQQGYLNMQTEQLAHTDFTETDRTPARITQPTRPGGRVRSAEIRSLPGRLPAAVVKPAGCTTSAHERPLRVVTKASWPGFVDRLRRGGRGRTPGRSSS